MARLSAGPARAPRDAGRRRRGAPRVRVAARETGGSFSARDPEGRVDPTGLVKGWAVAAGRVPAARRGLPALVHLRRRRRPGPRAVADRASAWVVGIAAPDAPGELLDAVHLGAGGAVATSGPAERGSHIWDPLRGRAARGVRSASVAVLPRPRRMTSSGRTSWRRPPSRADGRHRLARPAPWRRCARGARRRPAGVHVRLARAIRRRQREPANSPSARAHRRSTRRVAADRLQQLTQDTLDEATGRRRRRDPVAPSALAGRPATRELTAWTGILLLALFLAELVTLLDVHGLISWHIALGALLIPPALLKTATTGWRIVRYYVGDRDYRRRGATAHCSCACSGRSSSGPRWPCSAAGSPWS